MERVSSFVGRKVNPVLATTENSFLEFCFQIRRNTQDAEPLAFSRNQRAFAVFPNAPLPIKKVRIQISGFDDRFWQTRSAKPNSVDLIYRCDLPQEEVLLALAALETYVHLPSPLILPKNLVAVAAEIPDTLAREIITDAQLPADWQNVPPPDALKQLGSDWLQRQQTAVLVVPSSIIPDETNVLLNPAHADFAQIQIGQPQPFLYDPRMKK